MANLLVGHELDQGHVVCVQPSVRELLSGELGECIMEQVELDVLLVESEVERLEVKVAVILVDWGRVRGSNAYASRGSKVCRRTRALLEHDILDRGRVCASQLSDEQRG